MAPNFSRVGGGHLGPQLFSPYFQRCSTHVHRKIETSNIETVPSYARVCSAYEHHLKPLQDTVAVRSMHLYGISWPIKISSVIILLRNIVYVALLLISGSDKYIFVSHVCFGRNGNIIVMYFLSIYANKSPAKGSSPFCKNMYNNVSSALSVRRVLYDSVRAVLWCHNFKNRLWRTFYAQRSNAFVT